MELKFITASHDDVEDIYFAVKSVYEWFEPKTSDIQPLLMNVYRYVRDNIGSYTVVKLHGQKAAYYCFREKDGKAYIDDLYVRSDFRNLGIGSEIIHRCISQTEADVNTELHSANVMAVSLFRRMGFTEAAKIGTNKLLMCRKNT
ncbi:MAG: GNAT family N-acetyltransferase [Ruminococcaceae bacterium]|nr:GNAT family N-acetyltransferase [Oscillospiraceae bacterium]